MKKQRKSRKLSSPSSPKLNQTESSQSLDPPQEISESGNNVDTTSESQRESKNDSASETFALTTDDQQSKEPIELTTDNSTDESKVNLITASCVCKPTKARHATPVLLERTRQKLDDLESVVERVEQNYVSYRDNLNKFKDSLALIASLAALNFMALLVLLFSLYKP